MIGTTVTATIVAFRASVDAIKAAVSARDDRLIDSILYDMNAKIIDVQNACMALQEKHSAMADSEREAKEKLRQMKEQFDDFAQYKLHRTAQGGLVYRQKAQPEPGQLPVDICANCVAVGVKTFLQPTSDNVRYFFNCNTHGAVPGDKADERFEPIHATNYNPY